MTFLSYAQNYEDVRLWRAFRDVGKGRYIDIGSQDPVRDSVSLAFYERGWRGLHVEPTPSYARALRDARPDEIVVEAAVTTAPGPISFFEIPTTGLSTGIAEVAQAHRNSGWGYREILVPTVTLAGVFGSFGPELVHWLKIDVEGMEADVIASWGDHPTRPAVLIIEATAPLTRTKTHSAWQQMILDRGYDEVVFDGLSLFFVHKDHAHLREAIAETPSVFDGFYISETHFSARMLVDARDSAIAAASDDFQMRYVAIETAAADEVARAREDQAADQRRLLKAEGALKETSQRFAEMEGAFKQTLRTLSGMETELSKTKQGLHEAQRALDQAVAREAAAERLLSTTGGKLDALENENGQLLREAGFLRGKLEASTKAQAERLEDVSGRLERAEQELQSTSLDLVQANIELARLLSAQANLEKGLQRATFLLANAPNPYARLSSLRGALVRWLMPSGATLEMAKHNAAISLFQAEVFSNAGTTNEGAAAQMPPSPATSFDVFSIEGFAMINSDEPITSVPRLLEPHDLHFIDTAYQSILGRAPDPEGAKHYLSQLRSGTHKLVILGQLRRSREGRAFTPGVAGLDRAIKLQRRANYPLIGWVFRLFSGAEGNGATHRQLRVLGNEIGRMQSDQLLLARMIKQVADKTETINKRLETPPPPPAAPAGSAPAPIAEESKAARVPRLDQGQMPETFDSTERRVLGSMRLFARKYGAPE